MCVRHDHNLMPFYALFAVAIDHRSSVATSPPDNAASCTELVFFEMNGRTDRRTFGVRRSIEAGNRDFFP